MERSLLKQRAATLMELMVVIAIIAILAAIILSGLQAAKGSSKGTVSISQLRQLGVAGAIYSDEAGGFPDSTHRLVSSGLVKPELCFTPADPTPKGVANAMNMAHIYADPRTDYKNSYVGWLQFQVSLAQATDLLEGNGDAGWLVDLTPGQNPERLRQPYFWEGRYRRLLFDTAVVMRSFRRFPSPNQEGEMEMALFPVMFYMDDFERYQAWSKRRGL